MRADGGSMKFGTSIIGDVRKDLVRFDLKLAKATKGGIAEGTDGLKRGLRGQVRSAGMSQRLANTWQDDVYPRGPSKNAAGSVYSKAPHIIYAYDHGTVIRARNGRYLAVPLPETRKYINVEGRRTRLTPTLFQRQTGIKLVFLAGNGKYPVLAAIGARRSKNGRVSAIGTRKATKRLGERSLLPDGYGAIPMFVMIPQAAVRKKLDVAAAAAEWGALLLPSGPERPVRLRTRLH